MDLLRFLLRYETVLGAQFFLWVAMDILSAHKMVRTTPGCLTSMSRDFVSIKAAADRFVRWEKIVGVR